MDQECACSAEQEIVLMVAVFEKAYPNIALNIAAAEARSGRFAV